MREASFCFLRFAVVSLSDSGLSSSLLVNTLILLNLPRQPCDHDGKALILNIKAGSSARLLSLSDELRRAASIQLLPKS